MKKFWLGLFPLPNADRPHRKKPPSVQIRVSTDDKYPAVTLGNPLRKSTRELHSNPTRGEYHHQRKRQANASDLRRLAEEFGSDWLEDTVPGMPALDPLDRGDRSGFDREDDSVSGVIRTIPAIDWRLQPPIPADKIDWSGQGEPLRVRPTLGVIAAGLGVAASLLCSGAFFYFRTESHIDDDRQHADKNGLTWGVREYCETRSEARNAREAMLSAFDKRLAERDEQLKRELSSKPKKRRRK